MIVQHKSADGLKDEVNDTTFAFAFVFNAVKPGGTVYTSWSRGS